MFSYCCMYVLEKDVNELKIKADMQNKQINNIYELLETLTNESKAKNILEHFNNNVEQKTNDATTTTTSVI